MSPQSRLKCEFPLGGARPDVNSPVDCSRLPSGQATGLVRGAASARSAKGAA